MEEEEEEEEGEQEEEKCVAGGERCKCSENATVRTDGAGESREAGPLTTHRDQLSLSLSRSHADR